MQSLRALFADRSQNLHPDIHHRPRTVRNCCCPGGRGIVIRADGDDAHLVRREPEREAASALLFQKTAEPFVGAIWRLISAGAVVAGEDSRRRPEETIPSRRKESALNAISSWPGARPRSSPFSTGIRKLRSKFTARAKIIPAAGYALTWPEIGAGGAAPLLAVKAANMKLIWMITRARRLTCGARDVRRSSSPGLPCRSMTGNRAVGINSVGISSAKSRSRVTCPTRESAGS
jgi:hypothetical protein